MQKDQPEQAPEVDETVEQEVESPAEAEAGETTAQAEPEGELTQLLEDARSKADEHWDQLMRTRAELDNLRKRSQRDLENAHKFALERFSQELLQVWDSLELGHQAAQAEGADVEKLLEGTELTLKLLTDVMNKQGVEQIDPQDQPFDPDFHQAMTMQEREDVPVNTVVGVMQKGYTLNGRLLRPAMVMVSKGGAAPSVDEKA